MLVLVAKVWRRKLDYTKNLRAKYFTGENIRIYGTLQFSVDQPYYDHVYTVIIRMVTVATINFSLAWVQLLIEGSFY